MVDDNKETKESEAQRKSGSGVTEFTVTRDKVSELKVDGKRTVKVVTKKRRKFVKRTETAETSPEVEAAAETVTEVVEEAAPVESVAPEVVVEAPIESTPEPKKAEEKPARKAAPAKPQSAAPVPAPSRDAKPKARDDERKKKATKEKENAAANKKSKNKRLRTQDLRFDDDGEISTRMRRRKKDKGQDLKHQFNMPTSPVVREVVIPETITVADLASAMSIKGAEVVKTLMGMGVMATINQSIDHDTATLIVEEMGHKAVTKQEENLEQPILVDHDGEMTDRPPIVTIMGHVDHGKTSLLDYIRRAKVVDSEAGGITQHIGAYHVQTDKGIVSFLDTPGHAAFSAMRARGAQCTDVIVLVVAADDGVKPQTIEAIQHTKAAGVPMVVAVNKVDKDTADLDKVRTELSQHEVISEDWGGETIFVPVSAKTGQGIDDLLDSILLVSEVLELKAYPDGPGQGVIVESRLDKGRGPVATVLVQNGLLKQGDIVIAGQEYGRVRALLDENGRQVKSAGPSIPVEILGLSGAPQAGDELTVVEDDRRARDIAAFRQNSHRERKLARQQASKLEGLMDRMGEGDVKHLNIVLKADVQGSAEALVDVLEQLSNDEVKVKIVSQGVGGLNESDISLAMASEGIVIGFNVRADATARTFAEQEGIKIHYYSVIYDVIDKIEGAVTGLVSPKFEDRIVGVAEVKDVFRSSKLGSIAGSMVSQGTIKRDLPIRVLRNQVVIYEGVLESLRRFKDDVNEVKNGQECGIGVKNYNDVKVGDEIEVYEKVQI